MGEILRPATLLTELQEIRSRLARIEMVERVGLNRIRFARATASVDPSSFGAWEQGPAGSTWIDDKGNTGTGYPRLEVDIRHKAMIFFGAGIQDVAAGGSWRSQLVDFGVGINGHDPEYYGPPVMYRRWNNQGTARVEVPVGFFILRTDFTPNPAKQFAVWARWQDSAPSATDLPRMIDSFLCVLPID